MGSITVYLTKSGRYVVSWTYEKQMDPPQGLLARGHMEAYQSVKVAVPAFKVVADLDAVIKEFQRLIYEGHGTLDVTDAMPVVSMSTGGRGPVDPVPTPEVELSLIKLEGGYLVRVTDARAQGDVPDLNDAGLMAGVELAAAGTDKAAQTRALLTVAKSLVAHFRRQGGGVMDTYAFLEFSEVEVLMRKVLVGGPLAPAPCTVEG